MNSDQVISAVMSRASVEEVNRLNELRDSRSSKIDAFRGLMFKGALTYVSISVPMFLSASLSGFCKTAFAFSLMFALLTAVMLVVLFRKAPRQMAECFDKYVKFILTEDNRSNWAWQTSETWVERFCGNAWGWSSLLAFVSLICAVLLK